MNLSGALNDGLIRALPEAPTGLDKQIFRIYGKDISVARSNNWLRSFDFSGVAWDSTRAGTLIDPRSWGLPYSRRFVVMAKHYHRPKGSSIVFHDPAGKAVPRSLVDIEHVPTTDVTIGLLNADADGCAVYPVLEPGHDWASIILGTLCFLTDQERKVLIYGLSAWHKDRAYFYGSHTEVPDIFRERLVTGDSGNPTFLPYGDHQLVLLTTHWFGGAGGAGPNLTESPTREGIGEAMLALLSRNSS